MSNRNARPGARCSPSSFRNPITVGFVAVGVTLWVGCGTETRNASGRVTEASISAAVLVLDRAAAAMGTEEVIAQRGGFRIHGSGTLDKRVEGQGMAPDRPTPGPYRETVGVDLAGGRVAWEYREDRYDGTFEWARQMLPSDSEEVWVVPPLGMAFPTISSRHADGQLALFRRIPHLLVRELGSNPNGLRSLGRVAGSDVVVGTLETGEVVTALFDPATGVLQSTEYAMLVPAQGRRIMHWQFDDWRDVEGFGRYPHRIASFLDHVPYTDMTIDSVVLDVRGIFSMPAGVVRQPAFRLDDSPDPEASAPALEVRPVGDGVYVVPEVRGGFAPMVVEFDEYLLTVDAPASFPLLGTIPAQETDPGPNLSWSTERFVEALADRFPDKPIRYAVLTHYHEDHAGGLRALVAAGATVIGAPTARAAIERLLAIHAAEANDVYAAAPRLLQFEHVDSVRVITDGDQSVEIINVGANPHHDGMLVIRVVGSDLMFVSDLVTPAPLERYPPPSYSGLDRWFVQWLDREGFDPARIYAMHGSGSIGREHLEKLRTTLP